MDVAPSARQPSRLANSPVNRTKRPTSRVIRPDEAAASPKIVSVGSVPRSTSGVSSNSSVAVEVIVSIAGGTVPGSAQCQHNVTGKARKPRNACTGLYCN